MELDIETGVELIREARIQEDREKIYQLYVSLVPSMEKFVDFEEFYRKAKGTSPKTRNVISKKETKAEAMNKVEDILKNYKI